VGEEVRIWDKLRMRVLFIGSVEFSHKILEKLISIDSEIVGVCTKKTSPFNSDFFDLMPLCDLNSIPCCYINDINSKENIEWVKLRKPDIIFCFGWSALIKKELLSIPPMGVIGYHPTKLPKNRGRHPLIWPFILDMTTSASTFFFMNKGADDGDILSQVDFEILYEDNARSLYEKVTATALNQVEVFYPKLINGNYSRIRQENNSSNTWRKRHKIDGIIDFRMTSRAIYNLVRGLSEPYVGAHVKYKGKDVTIWKVIEIENSQNNIEPGKVIEVSAKSFIIKTMDSSIEIIDHDFESLPKKGEYL
jgi:methionyl-tRNA formyltransferase